MMDDATGERQIDEEDAKERGGRERREGWRTRILDDTDGEEEEVIEKGDGRMLMIGRTPCGQWYQSQFAAVLVNKYMGVVYMGD